MSSSYLGAPHAFTLPDIKTTMFAEFYGAMLGDGCIYTAGDSLCIVGNLVLDRWYVEEYLQTVCKKLFNITPRIYLRPNDGSIAMVINSKHITAFFCELGFPRGKKMKAKLTIPSFFFKNFVN